MTYLKHALALAAVVVSAQAGAQVIFYEHDGFNGRTFTARGQVSDFRRDGFNDLASSVVVVQDRWEVCTDINFGGRCIVLRPGRYPSLSEMGINDRISSVRDVTPHARIDDDRYAPPPPMPVYDVHRRDGERLFEARVTAVHAVVGPPQQRCWVEREQAEAPRGEPNMGGAIVGAIIGGVLGHQVGGGRGQDVATAGGAVGGAALGANLGRAGEPVTRDVQHCASTPAQSKPEYWDVTYEFRGQVHHMQTTYPPGATVTVNRLGEPRA